MPITRRWANDEQTILLLDFEGLVSAADALAGYLADLFPDGRLPEHVLSRHASESGKYKQK